MANTNSCKNLCQAETRAKRVRGIVVAVVVAVGVVCAEIWLLDHAPSSAAANNLGLSTDVTRFIEAEPGVSIPVVFGP